MHENQLIFSASSILLIAAGLVTRVDARLACSTMGHKRPFGPGRTVVIAASLTWLVCNNRPLGL